MDFLKEGAAWFAFAAWLSFAGLYALRAKWWKSPEGRNVMGVAVALAWVLGIIVAAYTWPNYDLRQWLVPWTYLILGVLAVQRTVQMLRRQSRRDRNKR